MLARRARIEALEDRMLLTAQPSQLVFIDLDGAADLAYRGPVTIDGVDMPAFRAPTALANSEGAIVAAMLADLRERYVESGVVFTTEAPDADAHDAAPFSTVFLGGDDKAFGANGGYWGLSEQVDSGNLDSEDNAFVFTHVVAADLGLDDGADVPTMSPEGFGHVLAAVVAHEVGHLLGAEHRHSRDGANASDADYSEVVANDPLADVAWKPVTHVETAKDTRADVVDDGQVTILGESYKVHPKIVQALSDYPGYYYSGAVGPDTFPDIVYGQSLVHPVDSGTWLTRVLDMAWAAQNDASFSDSEKSQILAFAYGFATHGAGDVWAHNLVNEFSEGVFPSFFTLATNDRNLANAVRHFIVEGYIGDATPGVDNDSERTLLPDGDIDAYSTPGSPMEAPNRFLYDVLFTPWEGDPTISDEFPKGDRGIILNQFIALRAQVEETATTAGPRPTESFNQLLVDAFGQLPNVPAALQDKLYRAYLYNWRDSLDAGFRDWGTVGLALARGLFNAQFPRDQANGECANQGSEVDSRRIDCEEGIGIVRRVLHELDDPNNDRRTDDSFINQHLLPMLGFPELFGEFRAALQAVSHLIDDNVTGPLRLALNPILAPLDRLKDEVKDLVVDWLTERFGIPPDAIDFLTNLPSKMDLKSITLGSQLFGSTPLAGDANADGIVDRRDAATLARNFGRVAGATRAMGDFTGDGRVDLADAAILQAQTGATGSTSTLAPLTLEMLKADDHERVDAIMGIAGIEQSEPLDDLFLRIPGVEFHEGARGFLNDNVEFDKQKFSAYANTVTLAKMLLLQETRVDGEFDAGQLSELMTNVLGQSYDFSLLNLNGAHGGSVITATLPKPGETVKVHRDGKPPVDARSDDRPWLVSIDTDHQWREDSQTTRTAKYRRHVAGTGANKATWTFAGLPAGQYDLHASWFVNISFQPARNAKYRIFDGAVLRGEVEVNQESFSDDATLGETFGAERIDIFYRSLGGFAVNSGTLRIELNDAADGDVVTGPMRIDSPLLAGGHATIIPGRDAVGAYTQTANSPYRETGANWEDLKYSTGTGNFPLWESEVLRPAFRALFRDWQNGDQNFPDLGDRPSADPNTTQLNPDGSVGPFVSAFEPLPPHVAPLGADVIVSGNQVLNLTGNVILGAIRGDGTGGLDSLTINTNGKVTFGKNVGGGGLLNLTINAGAGIAVDDGIVISTRQIAANADPRTASSTASSGAIAFNSPEIAIGPRAALVSHATGVFVSGDITLAASGTKSLTWSPGIVGFRAAFGSASIDVGPDVLIAARDIRLTTLASTSKSAELTAAGLPANSTDELKQTIDETEILEFSAFAAAVIADADASVAVAAGATLRADNDVVLSADATSLAIVTTRGRFLGVTYGSSTPSSAVSLANGVKVNAGRNVNLTSHSTNTLDVTTFVPGGGDVANVSFSYGKTKSQSKTEVAAGATIVAQNVSVFADNTNSLRNHALAAGFADSGLAGVGATAVLGTYDSDAAATVAGTITTSGNLTVRATSINTRDETRSFASVVSPTGASDLLQSVQAFLQNESLAQEVAGRTIDPNGALADFTVGGALTLVHTNNKAAALIDDQAIVSAAGNVTIDSQAEDNFRATATASAGNATLASIGGAVARSQVANQATTFVGYNAQVDADGDLNITANARVPNQVTAFDPTISLSDIDSATGTARIGEEFGDANAIGAAMGTAIAPLNAYLTSILNDPTKIGTTFVHAGGVASAGAVVGISGGVTALEIYNQGAAGIAAGARVNQAERFANPPAGQDVVVDAVGIIETTNVAGQNSALNFSGPGGIATVGGFFSGLFYDNHAKAYIDDRSVVSASHDVRVHSDTRNKLLTDVVGGSAAGDVSVDGAVAFGRLKNESLAYIEDRARVTARNNLSVDADNSLLAVQVAGATASGANAGVGAAAAIAVVTNTTRAFIGDSASPVGIGGTGGVIGAIQANGNLDVTADSTLEIWSIARSGAASTGTRATGGLEQYQGLEFGIGVSGDAAFNFVNDNVEAFVRDVNTTVGGALNVLANDDPFLAAGAGAVAFGNHTGIGGSFAHNGLTRSTNAYVQDATVSAADANITADADETVLTFSNGGSAAQSNVAIAGSVNANRLSRTTRAFVGPHGAITTPGDLFVRADDNSDYVSAAGSSSATANGFLAVGAALDLSFPHSDVEAFLGSETTVVAAGDIATTAIADSDVLSVAASMAQATGTGEATRLYRHNATANPYTTGVDIGGQTDLTNAVVLADLDGDTDLDLVTGNFGQFNRRYLNNGTGTFDAGETIGTDMAVAEQNDVELSRDQLINALTPSLTTSLATGDVDNDGDIDVVAGNLGQPIRLFLNDGAGNFFPAKNLGSMLIETHVLTSATADNVTPADLVADMQAALDASLVEVGLPPGDVTVALNAAGSIVFLGNNGRVLEQSSSFKASSRIEEQRRDGILETDALGTPLPLALVYDGHTLHFSVDPDDTLDNATPRSLVADIQAELNQALDDDNAGAAGSVRAQLDSRGRIRFVLGSHALGDATAAENIIAAARSGFKLVSPGGGNPVTFQLSYDGVTLRVDVDPARTEDNTTLAALIDDIRQAVTASLIAANIGVADDILVQSNGSGRIVFALPTHTLGDPTAAEDAIAAARRAGRFQAEDGGPLSFVIGLTDVAPTMSVALSDLDHDGDLDLVAGNIGRPNRVYLNLGEGRFIAGRDIAGGDAFTTSVTLADLDRDGNDDLVTGNVGINLTALVDQGLLRLENVVGETVVNIEELLAHTAVTLVDLVRTGLIERFDFSTINFASINSIIASGLANLEDLVRAGLIVVENFTNLSLPSANVIASGIVTAAELVGLIDPQGNVSMQNLVASGRVFLEELVREGFLLISDLTISGIPLGDLFAEGFDLESLVGAAVVGLGDLIRENLDLRGLIDSGVVSLRELVENQLLEVADIDLSTIDFAAIVRNLSVGAATKIFRGNGDGTFAVGVDLDTLFFITRDVTVGDVDGDLDLDIVLGNSNAPNRLYRNTGAGLTFAPGVSITSDSNDTRAVALADVDGDADLDLVVGNHGQTNRLYRNNGNGTFAAGTNITTDVRFTTSLAVGDVTGDGRRDIFAGNARPRIGVAGSASAMVGAHDVSASIGDLALVSAGNNVVVESIDQSNLGMLAGAAASGGTAGVGLSAALSQQTRNVSATIGDAEVIAQGTVANPQGVRGVFVHSTADEDRLYYAAGRAQAGDLGVAASVIFNDADTSTVASIDGAATLRAVNPAGTSILPSVQVLASHDVTSLESAGSFAGATQAGIGAAADIQLLDNGVRAFVGDGASITTSKDVIVDSLSTDSVQSIVAGESLGGVLSVAGSVAYIRTAGTTESYVGAASVNADGNVLINARSDATYLPTAGSTAFDRQFGIGISVAAVVRDDTTRAFIAEDATIKARGLRGTFAAFNGQETAAGVEITRLVRGLVVTALSDETITPIAAGGAQAGVAGGAGSITATVLNETTKAWIDANAAVNQFSAGESVAQTDQSVIVLADDDTTITGIAGTSFIGSGLGVGASVDFGAIVKETEAFIAGIVDARLDVEVQALSSEDLASLSNTDQLLAFTSFAVAGAAYAVNLTTRASIADAARVRSSGNTIVNANDELELDAQAGTTTDGKKRTKGAAVGGLILEKITEAFVGPGAIVTALGTRTGFQANTGEFDVTFSNPADRNDEVSNRLTAVSSALGAVFNNQVINTASAAMQDLVGFGFAVSSPGVDASLTQQRLANPRKKSVQGLVVTATSRDDVEGVAVGQATTNRTRELSGVGTVVANRTSAYIDSAALVNQVNTGAGVNQGVHVASGSDTSVYTLAGTDVRGLLLSAGGAAGLVLLDSVTEAFIGEQATVTARGDVSVLANAREDVLAVAMGMSIAVGFTLAPSVPVISLNSRTHAFVNRAANVSADGNLTVLARDDTDTDILSGAATVQLAAGAGVSAGVTIIDKDTQAWIGENAHVNAKGLTATTTAVLDGTVSDASIPTETIHGVAVQALSSESVFSVVSSGAAGGLNIGGAINAVLLESDTNAFVDEGAQVNVDPTGASALQTVNISAVNDARVFGAAVNLTASAVALAGSVDVGIIRNDVAAFVGAGADVRAKQDIEVHALSRKDADSFVGALGAAVTGFLASYSIYSIRTDFDVEVAGRRPLDFLNTANAADSVQHFLDNQVFQYTRTTGQGLSGLLGAYAGVIGGADTLGTAIEAAAPTSALGDAVQSVEAGDGNRAFVTGANLSAGRDVQVTASERLDDDLNTTFTFSIVPNSATPLDSGILHTSGSAVASIEAGSTVTAGGNVTIHGDVDHDQTILASSTTSSTAHVVNAKITSSQVTAGGNLSLTTGNQSDATSAGILPGFIGTSSKAADYLVRDVVDSHVSQESNASADAITLSATNAGAIHTLGVSTTMVEEAGIFSAFVAQGRGEANFDIASTVTAYVDDSAASATSGAVSISAMSSPTIQSIGIGVAQSSSPALGGSVAHNTIANVVDAHINAAADVDATANIALSATDTSTIKAIAGAVALLSPKAVGAAFATNDVHNTVRAAIDGADVDSSAGDVTLTTDAAPTIEVLAVGAAQANNLAGGGSVPLNDVGNVVESVIVNSASVTAQSDVTLSATSQPTIRSLAGGAAGSLGRVGVGAAVAKNDIADRVEAKIDHADVIAATGGVSLAATSLPTIKSLAVGAAIAADFAFAGSVSINTIGNTVRAAVENSANVDAPGGAVSLTSLDDSTIDAIAGSAAVAINTTAVGGSVARNTIDNIIEAVVLTSADVDSASAALSATDDADIHTIAGGGSGSGTNAASAGVADNDISNHVTAAITGATVDATGLASLSALESATIEGIAAGVSVSGSVSVTGGVMTNLIDNITAATISGGAIVTTGGNASLAARDEATIRSLTGQISGSGATAIGAAASYNKINDTVRASVDGASLTSTGGGIAITSDADATIETIAASGSLGAALVGAAGSVTVNLLGNTVEALVRSATVTAEHNLTLLADVDNSIKVYAGTLGVGVAGFGGSSVVNHVENTTKAFTDTATIVAKGNGGTSNIPQFNRDSGVESLQAIRGLAVVATANEAIEVRSVTGAGGSFALSANVSVNNVSDTTEAQIRGSTVNSSADFGEAVIVRAHQDTDVDIFAGAAAIGAAAVGAAVDTTFVRNTTKADIINGAAASVVHARGVDVGTVTRETVTPIVAGAALAGAVAIAGAVSVAEIASNNDAFIEQSDVFSQGTLTVIADNTALIDSKGGTVAGAAYVGTGGSVGVNSIKNTTRARTVGAHLNATTATTIEADTDETINGIVGTAGVGLAAGLAGAVFVNTIEATTEATTASVGTRHTQVNQDPAYRSGGAFGVSATQTFRLEADDVATINDKAGALGVGAAGIGTAVDVGAVRNRTVAEVGLNTDIATAGDTSVLAFSNRNADSLTAAGGGGLAGLSGAISSVSLGAPMTADGSTQFTTSLRTQVNNDIRVRAPAFNTSDSPVATDALSRTNGLAQPNIDSALSTSTNTTTKITGALIQDATSAATAPEIVSGGDIILTSSNTYDVDITAGQASVGVIGLGLATGAATVTNRTQSFVGNFGILDAVGDVVVSAIDHHAAGEGQISVFGGQVGLGAFGGANGKFLVTPAVEAHVGSSAVIRRAGSVQVIADLDVDANVDGRGFSGGLGAAGQVSTLSQIGGSVLAQIETNAQLGNVADVGALTVNADADIDATAFSKGGTVGFVSSGHHDATSRVTTLAEASAANASVSNVSGDVLFRSRVSGTTDADVEGVSVAAGAVGQSLAIADQRPTVRASLANVDLHHADNVTIEAIHDSVISDATSDSSAGGVISGNGGEATATSSAIVDSFVADGADVDIRGALVVRGISDNRANAAGDGSAVGLVGVGGIEADAAASGSTRAHVDGVIHADSLRIEAVAVHIADATSDASSGGLASGNSGDSRSVIAPTVEAYVDAGGAVTTGGNVLVRADLSSDADATVNGVSGGGVTIGSSISDIVVDPTVDASIRTSATIDAGGRVDVESRQGKSLDIENGTFNGTTGVDLSLNRIIYDEAHRLIAGDEVIYENNGNPNIGGLVDGRRYRVVPINSQNLELAVLFDASSVDAHTDTIHFDQRHDLETGDRVIYSTVSAPVVTGLTNAGTFFVRKIDDHTIKLATSLAAAQAALKTFDTPSAINNATEEITLTNHGFTTNQAVTYRSPTDNGAIGGLVNGRTYYIFRVDANRFRLSEFAGGPTINLDSAGTRGTHQIGVEGIDLSPSFDEHKLSIDLTAAATGSHRFIGVGGAQSVILPPVTDRSISLSKGSQGSFVGVITTTALGTVTPTVTAAVESSAQVNAASHVNISTVSDIDAFAEVRNKGGGFVSAGQGTATLTVDNTNTARVGASATINAGGVFNLLADSNEDVDAQADTAGGGGIQVAVGFATTDLDHATTSQVQSGAQITAAGSMVVKATTGVAANTLVNAGGLGFAVGGAANDDRGLAKRGVLIGSSTAPASTQAIVDVNALLSAVNVTIDAQLDALDARSDSDADSDGGIADPDAVARVEVFDLVEVKVADGAQIRGRDTIDLTARHASPSARAFADAQSFSVGSDADAQAVSILSTTTRIDADPTAVLTTFDLDTRISSTGGSFIAQATKDGGLIDLGSEHETATRTMTREILFDAAVHVIPLAPELLVNEAGMVLKSNLLTVAETATRVTVNPITNGFAPNGDPQRVQFAVSSISGQSSGRIRGLLSDFTIHDAFETVKLVNRSTKELEVSDLDVISRTYQPEIEIDVESIDQVAGIPGFAFDVLRGFGPTAITIANESTVSAPDVIIDGVIENPVGSTSIIAARGDVLSGNASAMVRTNLLSVATPQGGIATSASRLNVDLVRSAGRSTDLTTTAALDVNLNLEGHLRDAAAGTFDIDISSIAAGGNANVFLQPTVRETTMAAATYQLAVSEPDVPRTTTINSHFRPSFGDPVATLDLGVFGINPVSQALAYNIAATPVAGSLTITGIGSTPILIDGMVGVTGSGAITLSKLDGQTLQVVGGSGDNTITLQDWINSVTVNGGVGTDQLLLNSVRGSIATTEPLTLTGNVVTSSAGSTLITGQLALSATTVFFIADSAVFSDTLITAAISGVGGITKQGTGNLQLSGANNYTGTTRVEAGSLFVDGPQGGSAVTLAGGTLGGSGVVDSISNVAGAASSISPGVNTTRRLTADNGVTLGTDVTYVAQINGTSAGTQYDQLDVLGAASLGNATLSVTVGFASTVGNAYTIVRNDGVDPTVGTFNGRAENSTFLVGAIRFRINYNAGDGNDVVLTHIAAAFGGLTVTSPIEEGGVAIVSGQFSETDGPNDVIVTVNWGDGTSEESITLPSVSSILTIEHAYADNSPSGGPFAVELSWRDANNATHGDVLSISVENAPPTLSMVAPDQGVQGEASTIRLFGDDPSPADAAAGFTYTIDWGDGTNDVFHGRGATEFGHVFTNAGNYVVRATARDKDGAVSETIERAIEIRANDVVAALAPVTEDRQVARDARQESRPLALDAVLAKWRRPGAPLAARGAGQLRKALGVRTAIRRDKLAVERNLAVDLLHGGDDDVVG